MGNVNVIPWWLPEMAKYKGIKCIVQEGLWSA